MVTFGSEYLVNIQENIAKFIFSLLRYAFLFLSLLVCVKSEHSLCKKRTIMCSIQCLYTLAIQYHVHFVKSTLNITLAKQCTVCILTKLNALRVVDRYHFSNVC